MYLKENEIECDYTGIDIIPDFIEYCCGKYPGREFYHKNILTDTASIPKADIVISLGTLNFKLSVMENLEYTREFMRRAYEMANEMVVLDFLSTQMTDSYPKEEFVYYHSPKEIIDMAFELTNNIQLVHNYKPIPQKEFMIYLWKEKN